MTGPSDYFVQGLAVKWYNPKRIQEMQKTSCKYINRMCQDFYFADAPKWFIGIIAFNWYHHGKSYNPALHAKRGVIAVEEPAEFLSCDCGRTTWAFSEKAIQYRREISQRKARYKYPHKFEDWF